MANFWGASHDAQRDKQSQEQLAKGGLTVNAEKRLADLKQNPNLFTSDLSVSEFALCSSLGIKPLGQVNGATVYQTAGQRPPWLSGELSYMTRTAQKVRQLVFSRLQQEAALLGADAVAGVHLAQREVGAQQEIVEWAASGTAISWNRIKTHNAPLLCALSLQELWALHQSGYVPVGLAAETCAYYSRGDKRFLNSVLRAPYSALPERDKPYSKWLNREDAGLTMGIYQARAKAMQRLETEAAQSQAVGVIGIQWEIKIDIREEGDINDTFRQDASLSVAVLGTAITSVGSKQLTIDYCLPLT